MVQHDKEILNSIYGWHGQANGKAERPKCFLPECIKERIRYFQPQMEEGLTFERCLQYILATKESEKDLLDDYYEFTNTEWLPVSDEVAEWHNSPDSTLASFQVAVAMLYGYSGEEYQVKYGDYYFNNSYLLVSDPADYTHFSQEGAEKAEQLLKPRYFVRDARFCDFHRSIIFSEDISLNTKISEIYNTPDYVFLFKVGQQDVGMSAKSVNRQQPECVHFATATRVLKSIQNIKPEILKESRP